MSGERCRDLPAGLLEVAEREMPCICAEDYTRRGMFDPHCRCSERNDAVPAA